MELVDQCLTSIRIIVLIGIKTNTRERTGVICFSHLIHTF